MEQRNSSSSDAKTICGQDANNATVDAQPAKPRVDCIDGCRFALVFPIIIGHFIRFGTDKEWVLKLLTQENVLVGGFFIISGYVIGYTSTNIGELSCDRKKLANPELYFWQKVMSYYPLHFVVSTVFAPMFVLTERWAKKKWRTTGLHAFLNYTLLQAWFSSEAELWNPPTWFLSALTFANFTMPTLVLPRLAGLSKDGLWKMFCGLTSISLLQKLSYSTSWQFFCEGNFKTKTPPNRWNLTRFNPLWALFEVMMGIIAARDVMLDAPTEAGKVRNPLWLFVASYASLALRLTPRLNFNDAMIRTCVFIPLYTKFLQTLHRDSASSKPSMITRFLGCKAMAHLGSLAFPMFILHGPIGQIFYKKKLATWLWGRVVPKSFFPVWLATVLIASHIVNEIFVKSATVQGVAAHLAKWLARRTQGMLRDNGCQQTCQAPVQNEQNSRG
eukprot:TRINITY_DN9800_c0_g1_i1.p1 TRINITY_DN9800_c0_g1~~TRINITY_DN9800_c0_g1_i1.p1  ORF type:complete len:444 (+),score=65.26 TRINITY_DN9800_c0_g1_i1:49-1380(+)